MGGCCACWGGGDKDDGKEAFKKESVASLPVKNRGCTDWPCIGILLAAQVIFIINTIMGFANGDPTKLYKPRDYQGAYCGVDANWNDGPVTTNMPKLSYTMNVTSAVDMIMKQMLCSDFAQTAFLEGSPNQGIGPLLATAAAKAEYRCDCCIDPCDKCTASFALGPGMSSGAGLGATISARMSDLTNPSSAANLFSPNGANGDFFSAQSFWDEATKYFNQVCLPDCNTNFANMNSTGTPRNYTYVPSADDDLHNEWQVLLGASDNVFLSPLKATIDSVFTFRALPPEVCPYNASECVPMPGLEFKEVVEGASYCSFEMGAEVADAVGSFAASAMSSTAGSAIAEGATTSFGDLFGDFMASIDTYFVIAVFSFVIGIIFLVLLRLFLPICVWFAVTCTILMFVVGGGLCFVRSGQCQGAGLFESGQQQMVAVVVTAQVAATNTFSGNGTGAVSEALTGDGADYRGVQHYTINGIPCAKWDEQTALPQFNSSNFPESDLRDNYCRNPYAPGATYKNSRIWCVTTDPQVRWEVCSPVGVIQPACEKGYEVKSEQMREALKYGSYIIWGLGGLWFLIILCLINRIKLAIALNQVAAEFLAHNPLMLLVPVFQGVVVILWSLAWVASVSFLLSQVPDDYTPMGYYATYAEAYGTASACAFWDTSEGCQGVPGACTDKWPTGSVYKDSTCEMVDGVAQCWRCSPPRYVLDWRFAISFFVFLWNNAFLVALGQILVAMGCALWFFSAQKGKERVFLSAVRTVFRYHIGSVALGSFIVAVVQFIRYLMKYFEKQAAAQKNRIMVLVLKVVQCCIWCFEKCIKFLNKNAYIQIAINGKWFCPAAKKAFWLIMRNALRFGTAAMLGSMITLVGYASITTGTAVVGYFLVQAMHPEVSPVMPVVCFAIMGSIVSKIFMTVFHLASDTSMQCFLIVEETKSDYDVVPGCLKSFLDKHTKKNDDED